MKKWLILGSGQEIYKINLECLTVAEYKEVLKKQTNKQKQHPNPQWYVYNKGTQKPTERIPNSQSWNKLSNKINKSVFDYNLKCKINKHESLQI